MIRLLLFPAFMILFVPCRAQENSRFITGKHYNLGMGWSDLVGPGLNNSGRVTTEIGVNWEARRTERYLFEFGIQRNNFKYITGWQAPRIYEEQLMYKVRMRETAFDFHIMNWYRPISNLPIQVGLGTSIDFIFAEASLNLYERDAPYMRFVPINPDVEFGLMIQPAALAGIRYTPGSMQRFSFDLNMHYGIYSPRNLLSPRHAVYNYDNFTAHRVNFTFGVNYSIDLAKQREKKNVREQKRKLRRGEDSVYVSFKNSVYVEGLGSGGLGSLNYERQLISNHSCCELRVRIGIGGNGKDPSAMLMPVFNFGYKRLRGEISSGIMYYRNSYTLPLAGGIRYESKDGILARLTYTPILLTETRRNYPFPICFGGSVGFQF